ncbi:MAG: hypothetical protein ACI381_07920 [Candidatus Methanomethylophilaceae archaeon]
MRDSVAQAFKDARTLLIKRKSLCMPMTVGMVEDFERVGALLDELVNKYDTERTEETE